MDMRNKIWVGLVLLVANTSFGQMTFTSSNLPIIVINTNGTTILDDPKIVADMKIVNNAPGLRNDVTGPFNNYNGKIGIELHGSSSQLFPKKPFGIELQDAAGKSIDAALLGMPKKDDWILLAAYDDKSLMRDALAYKLGRDQGRYAARTRFCELVINNEYQGVYILAEKIKRDKNRVNIAKIDPTSVDGDLLTGGYIIKIDKSTGSGGAGWNSSFLSKGTDKTIFFQYEYPKQEDIVPEQMQYIKNYVNTFETALAGQNFADTVNGYAKYIDVNSFIDFFIMNEVTKNPDGYRLSTFLYKKKDSEGGKLSMGPIWDFNEGFGNVDYCTQGNPEGFAKDFNLVCPEDYWQIPFWWNRLFNDPRFSSKVSARWSELRSGKFETNKVLAYVDSVATTLKAESAGRNFQQWPILGKYVWPNYYVGPTYQSEVEWLKTWITKRFDWLDDQLFVITGVEEKVKHFQTEIFPNPFMVDFQLNYEIDIPGQISVDAYNMLGQKIFHAEQNQIEKGKYQLSLHEPGWAAGTYYFKTSFNDEVIYHRVVKK